MRPSVSFVKESNSKAGLGSDETSCPFFFFSLVLPYMIASSSSRSNLRSLMLISLFFCSCYFFSCRLSIFPSFLLSTHPEYIHAGGRHYLPFLCPFRLHFSPFFLYIFCFVFSPFCARLHENSGRFVFITLHTLPNISLSLSRFCDYGYVHRTVSLGSLKMMVD